MSLPGSIIILTPGFPVDENDTSCLPSQQLFVRSLNRLFPKIEVIVVSLQYPAHKTPYNWFGNSVIPFDGKSTLIVKPIFWIRAINRVIDIAKEKKAKAIISFWCQETSLIGMRVSKRLKIKHRVWISGQDARKGNRWMSLMKPPPEMLVAMSPFLQDEFFKNYQIRPEHVIRNGVEESLFSKSIPPKDIDVIGVGSLIRLKQYDKFIEVVDEIKKINPNVKAVLVGDGPEQKPIEQLIARKNLTDNITLFGGLSHEEAIHLLERSKVLLHPSSYEGYSTVCLEALYAGCAVVSFTFAENEKIQNWHIVETIAQMTRVTSEILNANRTPERILINSMDKAATDFISLLNDPE
jgi:glycosyltransferase involved in cell wall biosynthesis